MIKVVDSRQQGSQQEQYGRYVQKLKNKYNSKTRSVAGVRSAKVPEQSTMDLYSRESLRSRDETRSVISENY